jgi:periplasmic copper chaperone A
MHRTARRLVPALAAVAGVVALAAPVGAHISPTEDEYAAGSFALIELSVPHGCGESPTTGIAIQIPEPINSVTPTVNPGWDVEIVMEDLAEPIDAGDGEQITERVSEVDYTTDSPLPPHLRTSFTLSLQIPDVPGDTLSFPVIQTCEEGQTDWIEVPAEGQDPEELEHPAPAISVVAGDGSDGHVAEADEATDDAATDDAATVDGEQAAAVSVDDSDDGSDALAIVALVVGALGLVVGGAALVAARKKPAGS